MAKAQLPGRPGLAGTGRWMLAGFLDLLEVQEPASIQRPVHASQGRPGDWAFAMESASSRSADA